METNKNLKKPATSESKISDISSISNTLKKIDSKASRKNSNPSRSMASTESLPGKLLTPSRSVKSIGSTKSTASLVSMHSLDSTNSIDNPKTVCPTDSAEKKDIKITGTILEENSSLSAEIIPSIIAPTTSSSSRRTSINLSEISTALAPRRLSIFSNAGGSGRTSLTAPGSEESKSNPPSRRFSLNQVSLSILSAQKKVSVKEEKKTDIPTFIGQLKNKGLLDSKIARCWKLLHLITLCNYRLSKASSNAIESLLNKTTASKTMASYHPLTLSAILKNLESSPEAYNNKRIKAALMSPIRDIEAVEAMIRQRVKGFSIFPIEEALHICKTISYDFYRKVFRISKRKGRVLLWEEHLATCFYIIVTGCIDIFKINGGSRLALAKMSAGQVFGHARIRVEGATRSACAIVSQDTIILTVNRDDYILYKAEETFQTKKLASLKSIPIIAEFILHNGDFDKLNTFTKFEKFPAGHWIQKEGESADRMYFIIAGDCTVLQKICLVSRTKDGRKIEKPYTGQSLGEGEKLVYLELPINHIGPPNWFPQIQAEAQGDSTLEYVGASGLNKPAFQSFYSRNTGASYSVKASSEVQAYSLKFAEVIELMPNEILYKMVFHPDVVNNTTLEIQNQYFSNKAWEKEKLNILGAKSK